MKARATYVLTQVLVPLLSVSLVFAQETVSMSQQDAPTPSRTFTQQELDQMLAPIALYPDSLLSQILMASTYPLEVVEAARWSRANPTLKGDQAVQAVAQNTWDPSVKSLVAFPQVLQTMDEKLDWTERLGDFVGPGFGVGFVWGVRIPVGVRFFFGAFDWPHRHVTVVNVNNFHFKTVNVNRVSVWQHDPVHRRGVLYREASLRQQFRRTSASPEARH